MNLSIEIIKFNSVQFIYITPHRNKRLWGPTLMKKECLKSSLQSR